MEKQTKQNTELLKHRVITLLDRHELEFLNKLGNDAMFSTGHKLTYNEILKGLIEFAMEIGLSGEGIRSLKDLKEKILHAINKAKTKEDFPTPYEILNAKQEQLKEQSLKSKDNDKNE
jgi:hypothetical protein